MANYDNNIKLSLEESSILDQVFFNKYQCIQKIGEGSFGVIYKAEYNGNYYAVKFEKKKSRTKSFRKRSSNNELFKRAKHTLY